MNFFSIFVSLFSHFSINLYFFSALSVWAPCLCGESSLMLEDT